MANYALDVLEKLNFNYYHQDLYKNDTLTYITSSLSTIWRILTKLFIWFEYHMDECSDLIKKTFSILIGVQYEQESSFISTLKEVTIIFERYDRIAFDIHSAFSLYNLIKKLEMLSDLNHSGPKLALKFFCHEWYTFANKKEEGQSLNKMLTVFINDFASTMMLATVDGDIKAIKQNVRAMSKDCIVVKNYPNITGKNFLILYKGVGLGLAYATQTQLLQVHEIQEKIDTFKQCFTLCQDLLQIAKILDDFKIWGAFLKNCCRVLKIFVDEGIELVKSSIIVYVEEIKEMIKLMQNVTRKCTHLCNHGKIVANTHVINFAPEFRFLAETIIVKMKNAFAANDLLGAWGVAQLKMKNIYGETISSQRINIEETNSLSYLNDENQDDGDDNTEGEHEFSKIFE